MSSMLENNIRMFTHCKLCFMEKPANIAPRDWVMMEAGWTVQGLQLWCRRHECNIIHIDFEGAKHPAYLERKPSLEELNGRNSKTTS